VDRRARLAAAAPAQVEAQVKETLVGADVGLRSADAQALPVHDDTGEALREAQAVERWCQLDLPVCAAQVVAHVLVEQLEELVVDGVLCVRVRARAGKN
jgi:hypothetical protein